MEMDADGFKAVRRRRVPRKPEAVPYEGAEARQDPEAIAAAALADAGTAEMEEEASALLRHVGPSELEDTECDIEGEDSTAMEAEGVPTVAPDTGKKKTHSDKRAPKRGANNEKQQQDQPFIRRLPVPQHRYTPLRQQWVELIKPLIMHMKLQVRMNIKRRCVELRAAPAPAGTAAVTATTQLGDDNTRLGKGADYVRAFLMGFEQRDCVALLRLDDMYLETFEIQDVKRLTGAHFSRCIGRLTGRNGSTRFAIENATRTRIVIAGRKIHILGSFDCIKLARHSICSLILGKPQGKVYCHLRTVAKRLSQRM